MNYLPSKKFVLVVLAISMVALAVIMFQFFPFNSKEVAQKNDEDEARAELLQKLQGDSDGDGLRDWEEVLWKTDPQKNDTDGDGTPDNDEILVRRDPKIPGPGDEIKGIPASVLENVSATISTERNLTAELAKDFTSSYFIRKMASVSESNELKDKETLQEQVFTSIANTIETENTIDRTPQYTEENFIIIPEISSKNTRTYINALGALFRDALFPEKNEMEIISEVASGQNLESLQNLPVYSKAYQKLAEEMKMIPVPKNHAETHVRMANNFWRLGGYLQELSLFQTDPVKGLAALVGYSQESAQAWELLKIVMSEIKAQNISFSVNEGGAEFNKYADINT